MARSRERRPRTSRRSDGRRDRRDRSRQIVWAVRLLVLAVVFGIGVAVGRAVEGAPKPGGTQTLVRTLVPTTVGPAERTVTVTVATP
jgi:hypothetical protein